MYDREQIRTLARSCGFELCGFASAAPTADFGRYETWVAGGHAGDMRYLTDRRMELRRDPASLLASAKTVICLGKIYNWPLPCSTEFDHENRAWISRYAWGDDYHDVMRASMSRMVSAMAAEGAGEFRICVDTEPLLERSYARLAGLGWIGRNMCLINQYVGSWIFLGEILTSIELAPDAPPPDRCGTCRRCIDACPTQAIVPSGGGFTLDARLCISYFTIELRGGVPEEQRRAVGANAFGCDICQDVCPWNRRAAITHDPSFAPRHHAPDLARLAELSAEEFSAIYRDTPIARAKYAGFLRNVAIAMGNSGNRAFVPLLEKLQQRGDAVVTEHSQWAIRELTRDG